MDPPFQLGAILTGLNGSSEEGCSFTVVGVDPPAVVVSALNEFWSAGSRAPASCGPHRLIPASPEGCGDWIGENARDLPWFIFRADGTFVHCH